MRCDSEAPLLQQDGAPVKGMLTPQMEALQQLRIDAEHNAEDEEEDNQTRQERAHNKAELVSFYRKFDKARVAQVGVILEHYALEHSAGLCKLRYGEAPHFVVKGKFVKGTLTPSIQAQQEARIAAEGTNGIATDVIVVVFDDGEVCKQALCLRQRTHLLFAASLEWT